MEKERYSSILLVLEENSSSAGTRSDSSILLVPEENFLLIIRILEAKEENSLTLLRKAFDIIDERRKLFKIVGRKESYPIFGGSSRQLFKVEVQKHRIIILGS